MTEPQTDPNEDQRRFWSDGPGRTWAAIADTLDAVHVNVDRALIAAAAPSSGERVIDIGSGAGATSMALAALVGRTGSVTGLDISESLVAEARRRVAGRTPPVPEFRLADAQTGRPDGPPADLVVSRMGVMFFADPVAAFANIRDMLRPGGRLAFICWRTMEENPWFALPFRAVADRLGAPDTPADPHAPGPMAFADIERVTGILREAGFGTVTARTVEPEIVIAGGADAAARLCTRIGPVAHMLRISNGTDADRAAIVARLREDLAPFERDGTCRVPARMNLFTAARP